jgi:hypothetical protein
LSHSHCGTRSNSQDPWACLCMAIASKRPMQSSSTFSVLNHFQSIRTVLSRTLLGNLLEHIKSSSLTSFEDSPLVMKVNLKHCNRQVCTTYPFRKLVKMSSSILSIHCSAPSHLNFLSFWNLSRSFFERAKHPALAVSGHFRVCAVSEPFHTAIDGNA